MSRSAVASVSLINMTSGVSVYPFGTGWYCNWTVQVNQAVVVTRTVPNETNERLMVTIISLTTLDVVLVLYIFLLLLARYEYVDVPEWLGGLNKPVDWWRNPSNPKIEFCGYDDAAEEEYDDEEEGEEEEEDADEGELESVVPASN